MKRWQWVKHALHSLVKHPPLQTEPAVNVNVHQLCATCQNKARFPTSTEHKGSQMLLTWLFDIQLPPCKGHIVWPPSCPQLPHVPWGSPQTHRRVSASRWRKAAGERANLSLTPLFQWTNRIRINSKGIPGLLFRFSPYDLARNHSNPQETPLRKAEYVISIRAGKQAIWREVGSPGESYLHNCFKAHAEVCQHQSTPPKKIQIVFQKWHLWLNQLPADCKPSPNWNAHAGTYQKALL